MTQFAACSREQRVIFITLYTLLLTVAANVWVNFVSLLKALFYWKMKNCVHIYNLKGNSLAEEWSLKNLKTALAIDKNNIFLELFH